MKKHLITLSFCGLLLCSNNCFAAEIAAQTTDKELKTEVTEVAIEKDKQNITIININRTWFCFINKGFKTNK